MNQDVFVVIEHLQGRVSDSSYAILAAGRDLGNVTAVLLGHNAAALATDLLADRVLYTDHPALAEFTTDAYLLALESTIREHSPRAVLFAHSSIGMDLAAGLSARLQLPVVSSCRSFSQGKFISQICGGKIMVEGDLPLPTAIVTVAPGGYKPEQGRSTVGPAVTTGPAPALEGLRISLKKYLEPEVGGVDITKVPILVAVGRGIQTKDNLQLANDLAQALGGEVCASRPVVDQGWLPLSRLVGKSSKHVKARVYLALGISGAPEHVEGMGASELIFAINTDAKAPIFSVAQYGSTIDLLELVPVLTEKARAERHAERTR